MEEFTLLKDIVMILGGSLLIIIGFQKIKIPPIIGFLIAGMLLGPHGFNLINDSKHEVEILSEIGIIFLLFVIGIEFSLKELIAIKQKVFWGGGGQVAGTILLITLAGKLFGLDWNVAVFFGFLISLSSTAIVLKLIQERGDVKSSYGKMSIGILIFQDIIVVPMILLIPILTGKVDNVWKTLGVLGLKVIGLLVVVYILARFIVPFLFRMVVKTKSQELFLLSVLTICFSTALLSASVGLSLALGAFFAGLIISESDYSHHATANVLPFREVFVSFFFVSVGVLLDLHFFVTHLGWIILISAIVLLAKMLILGGIAKLLKLQTETVLMTMFTLFQVGEFSLLLSGVGLKEGLLTNEQYQYFLAVSILTMAITPFVIAASPKLVKYILKKSASLKPDSEIKSTDVNQLEGHLVIVGYGLNGENLAKAARSTEIPYVVVELNNEAFNEAKRNYEPVVFGDASNELILKHIHVQEAKVVVIAISDPVATKNIIKNIREFSQTTHIIVRTRYVKEISENMKIGADVVIPEEFETSIQIFKRVLGHYMIPKGEIEDYVDRLRSSDYELLTEEKSAFPTPRPVRITEKGISTLRVEQGNNSVVGKSVFESQIRKNYGVTVLAIRRGETYITDLNSETTVEEGDILYVFGSNDEIKCFNKKLAFEV